MRKLFVYAAGTLFLAPLSVALCCEGFCAAVFCVVYGVFLWYSPKFSPKARKFWREFYKVNLEVLREFETRVR